MAEKQIRVNTIDVNYKIAGEGPAILVLHGWGGSSDSWTEAQEILSKEYMVIVPDLPGFGRTPPPQKAWGVKDYTDFVIGFAKKLGLSSFFLLGHSFGGRISIKAAVIHSQEVKKLILLDSAGIKPKPGIKTIIGFWAARIGNAIFTPKIFNRFKDSLRNMLYVFLRNKDYAKAEGTMRETIKRVLGEDLLSDLPNIGTETLIVWGEKDKMVPIKYAHIFKEKINDSRLEIISGVGHSPHLEAPQRLSEIIRNFFK